MSRGSFYTNSTVGECLYARSGTPRLDESKIHQSGFLLTLYRQKKHHKIRLQAYRQNKPFLYNSSLFIINQYFCFPGITPRTPPFGFGTSPL